MAVATEPGRAGNDFQPPSRTDRQAHNGQSLAVRVTMKSEIGADACGSTCRGDCGPCCGYDGATGLGARDGFARIILPWNWLQFQFIRSHHHPA